MIRLGLLFFNSAIVGFLILVFEHIEKYSFFGFLYPHIEFILISFMIYLLLFMYNLTNKPKGTYLFLILTFFILVHFLIAPFEIFKTSFVLISFILIASIVIKNSNFEKQMLLLEIIKYCCLINCIYGILFDQMPTGGRVGGLDQTPVLFGYNMLLGFWLSMISYKTKVAQSKLNSFYAIMFFLGILLSQSRGAIFGLITGLFFVFIYSKKINLKLITYIGLALLVIPILFYFNSSLFYEKFGLQRILDMFNGNSFDDERFTMWAKMINVYFRDLNVFNFLFGGGVGSGNNLINRGVHNDHLKIIFDFGIIGYLIYLLKIFNCFRLIDDFNKYLGGFLVSTLTSGMFYVNLGSITNSFSYILVLIVFFNFIKLNK